MQKLQICFFLCFIKMICFSFLFLFISKHKLSKLAITQIIPVRLLAIAIIINHYRSLAEVKVEDALAMYSISGTAVGLVNGYAALSKSGLFLLKCNERLVERLLGAMESHAHAAETVLSRIGTVTLQKNM